MKKILLKNGKTLLFKSNDVVVEENDILIELSVVNFNSRYTSNNFKFNLWHIPKPKNLLDSPTLSIVKSFKAPS